MVINCSFCNLSYDIHSDIVQRGNLAICKSCIALVKDIFEEFSKSGTYESGGVCSFCNKPHTASDHVFQGKNIQICISCLYEAEEELSEMSIISKEILKDKTKDFEDRELISRVRSDVLDLKAYSVPDYKCKIKLDGNESPFDLTADIKEKIQQRINTVFFNRYPDPQASGLRKQISDISGLPVEGIVLGNGSDELIEMIIRGFAGVSGKILIPRPTFSMYKLSAITLGLEAVEVELDDNFDIDIDLFKKQIEKDDPDVIFLATPNNPTGNCFSKNKILEIMEFSKGAVVIDEAYCDFSGVSFLEYLKDYPNLIILRTMSKVGFASLRLGILYASKNIVDIINKIRLPYNINSLSQAVAESVLENYEFVKTNIQSVKEEKNRVFERMKIIPGVEVFPTDANFILFKIYNADRIYEELIEKDILIRNFNPPGRLENCMRITIGTPEENSLFLKALSTILSS